MIINIQDDILKLHAMRLLDRLLQDKTTKANILWATDAYSHLGEYYSREKEIRPQRITGENSDLIKTRARREMEQRNERTRQHAEVFTPLWVVKKMNDVADEQWFGRKQGIYKLTDEGKIYFTKDKHWKLYVDARRLEITCGEAPFLATRYDVETGEAIPVEDRIGLLDRKLRAVSENAQDIEEWKTWALRAVQAIYGYELQGDNLLIARVNILFSVEEHMWHRWKQIPDKAWMEKLCNVICWNLWQMDGIRGCIPVPPQPAEEQLCLFATEPLFEQGTLFGETTIKDTPCRLKDWRREHSFSYEALRKRGPELMKFDFIIGNPPYQEETTIISETNGQLRRRSIFHLFQIASDELSTQGTALVYPAGRWIQRSGRGMNDFGLNQINDKRLSRIYYYPNAREVFPTTDIADGISIVIKKHNKKEGGFKYYICQGDQQTEYLLDNPGDDIMPLDPRHIIIVKKIDAFAQKYNLPSLHSKIQPQKLFGIESDFVEKNPDKVRLLNPEEEINYQKEIKLFTNDRAGKAGRSKWYIANKDCVASGEDLISKWKVVVSSANAGGQKRDNQLAVFDNHSIFGRSRIALHVFDTKQEAENFYQYMKTYFVRFAFLMTDENLGTLGLKVPDLRTYNSNPIVDFSNNLDEQLFDLCSFTDSEREYIIGIVDSLRKKQ